MARRQEDQGVKPARGSRLLLGLGMGALLVCAWGGVARTAGRRARVSGAGTALSGDAARASRGTDRAEGVSMGPSHFRPARRERLYDTDEQRRPGPASDPGLERGEQPSQGHEGVSQGSPPGDFRHGGLGVRGHVPAAPHAGTPEPPGSGGAPAMSRGAEAGDFGGGFQAWGHVPEASQGADHGGVQQDEAFDPDYLRWREEQLRQLDEDYRAWRRQKFAEDFSQWRARSSNDRT